MAVYQRERIGVGVQLHKRFQRCTTRVGCSGKVCLATSKPSYKPVTATFGWEPTGLFRFDGRKFERYHPSSGDPLLLGTISTITATPDGGLWIAHIASIGAA
jgi:hypothetical protein